MHPETVLPVLRFLPYNDVQTLKACLPSSVMLAALALLTQGMCLLMVLVTTDGAVVTQKRILAKPTANGYVVNGVHVSRRMFVHEVPMMCMGAVRADTSNARVLRVDSYLAFNCPGGAWKPVLPDTDVDWCADAGVYVWRDSLLSSPVVQGVVQLHSRDEWPVVFQRHARVFLAHRLRAPRRDRGRRRRRWTKVCPVNGPVAT